jgi:glycosyltransferase involved in cell wall biosynthesis
MSLNNRVKITFILPTLFAGGSERIMSYLAQNIDVSKFDATLLVIGRAKEAVYVINNIKVIYLEKARVLDGIVPLFKHIKLTKPDIVLSVISHLNTLMAYMSIFFPKTKFIARESTVLSVDADFSDYSKGFSFFGYLSKKRFNYFDKIICQSTDMLDDVTNNYNVKNDKLIVINNPITEIFEVKKDVPKSEVIKFITVARFSKEKGVPRILKILSKINIPFHYTLIGDGSESDTIFSLIEKYNLKDKITHIPFTNEVSKYLAESDCFLQGSYFEGFPNCLIESCIVGTPVIAFNVPGGTKEIIEDGVNGFLVKDEKEFIERLNENKVWSPERIRKSVYKKFNKDKILSQYEELFMSILK